MHLSTSRSRVLALTIMKTSHTSNYFLNREFTRTWFNKIMYLRFFEFKDN